MLLTLFLVDHLGPVARFLMSTARLILATLLKFALDTSRLLFLLA